MLRAAWLIACKDTRLVLLRGGAFVQALLLGLLLVFVFSLSQPFGGSGNTGGQGAATVFWLASVFCVVLAGNMLYALEEAGGARSALLLMPAPTQAVWLGKGCAALLLLLASQVVFFPAVIVFLAQTPHAAVWPQALAALLLVDAGLVGLGTLLGAFAAGQSARESLLSVLLFPLLIPLLLAGIQCGTVLFAGLDAFPDGLAGVHRWLGIAAAFDAVFLGAALILFPFVFGDDA